MLNNKNGEGMFVSAREITIEIPWKLRLGWAFAIIFICSKKGEN